MQVNQQKFDRFKWNLQISNFRSNEQIHLVRLKCEKINGKRWHEVRNETLGQRHIHKVS